MFGVEGLTGTLLFTIVVAAFGSAFQHGYNTGVVNAPQKVIEKWILELLSSGGANSTTTEENTHRVTLIYSTIVSIYCFGGLVGGLLTNSWSRYFGMKVGVIANNLFIFVAAALMGLSKLESSYYMLIIGRFLVGVNNGLNAGLVPMYLSEIPPTSLRGGVGSVYQLFLTISILISQILSTNGVLGNESQWPILFGLILIPAVLQMILLPLCADSPRYLHTMKREDDARNALRWLRGTDNVQTEIDILKSETDAASKTPAVDFGQLFTNPMLRKPLIISCVIMLSQQFSGINAVIFYSTSSFQLAKLSPEAAQVGTILMGLMNVAMTVISTLVVDKAGRKTLLGLGFGLMFVDTVLLCIALILTASITSGFVSYSCIAFVVLFVVFFAIGPGSIPWFLVSELFLPNARPLAISIAVAVNWGANFVVGLTFPSFQEILHAYVFVIFAILQLIFFIYILTAVPETKNRDITEITAEFSPKK